PGVSSCCRIFSRSFSACISCTSSATLAGRAPAPCVTRLNTARTPSAAAGSSAAPSVASRDTTSARRGGGNCSGFALRLELAGARALERRGLALLAVAAAGRLERQLAAPSLVALDRAGPNLRSLVQDAHGFTPSPERPPVALILVRR